MIGSNAIPRANIWSSLNFLRRKCSSRRTDSSIRIGQSHCGSGELFDKFVKSLPFELTGAQEKVIAEIRRDLAAGHPMNRLLQGDVGSGKTLVAIAAMLLAVEAGYQSAFMAPTQILAEQHYDVLRRWLDPLGVRVALRTGARQEESGALSLFGPAQVPFRVHQLQIIVGTHALLYESVSFSNLGLVVIDEQHKFGVAQRARLAMREPAPDMLVMTATPIPRTLTMTIYGDLDVSTIDEMPRNRGKIVTAVRDDSKLPEVLTFLRTELERGRQLYVIYPLIDESEKLDVKAATAEYQLWRERLGPFRCELLHGRIAPVEKHQIMEGFRRGETNVLISTTVLEVGVDVPNASVMLIENAERFGLAQLHQLRGRIGRGEHKSYCILLTSTQAKEGSAKLAVLERTGNGFEVAEADWESRREEIADMVVAEIARFAPDVAGCIVERQVLGPPDVEARIGLTGGHIFQGECLPDQMWDRRFRPATPVPGLWLCGAATHPGGSVIAANGRNAALAVLGRHAEP